MSKNDNTKDTAKKIKPVERSRTFRIIEDTGFELAPQGTFNGIIKEFVYLGDFSDVYIKPTSMITRIFERVGITIKIKDANTGKFHLVTTNMILSYHPKGRLIKVIKAVNPDADEKYVIAEMLGKSLSITIRHEVSKTAFDDEGKPRVYEDIVAVGVVDANVEIPALDDREKVFLDCAENAPTEQELDSIEYLHRWQMEEKSFRFNPEIVEKAKEEAEKGKIKITPEQYRKFMAKKEATKTASSEQEREPAVA